MTYPLDHLKRADSGRFQPNGGAERDAKVLAAAVDIASRLGLRHLTRAAVAAGCGLSAGSVSNFRRSETDSDGADHMQRLRDAVMQHAVDHGILPIIAQGLAMQDPIARTAPDDVKARAVAEAMYG